MSLEWGQHQPLPSHSPIAPSSLSQSPVVAPSLAYPAVVPVPAIQSPLMVQQFYQSHTQTPILVSVQRPQRNFFLRVLWYLCIGSWLGFCWFVVGYMLCVTVVLLPIGLFMLNRLPIVLTLRSSSEHTAVAVSNGVMQITIGAAQQRNILVRAAYFVLLGWWLAGIWALIGFVFCWLIIPLPLGLLMLNRLPAVLTLRRN